MATKSAVTPHRITRDELAEMFGVSVFDIEEACRRGDVPMIRSKGPKHDAMEVPAEFVEALKSGSRALPHYVYDPDFTCDTCVANAVGPGVAHTAEPKDER